MQEHKQVTALVTREGDGFVSICPEFDVASQGHSVDAACENLEEALELFFESASPQEIHERRNEVYVTRLKIPVG
jgi:predicted RNase H-like HicB family nuclease